MFVRQLILAMLGMAFAYFVRRAISQPGSGRGSSQGANSQGSSGAAGASAGRGKQAPAPVDGKMVRDRVCNTYLPEAKAVTVRQDGTTHYFCSDRCRQTFLSDRAAS